MGSWSPGPVAGGGNDTYNGDGANEIADGLGGADILNGDGGSDTLTGNDGDDTLRPGDDYVADFVSGGAGYDILDFTSLSEDGIIYLGTIAYRSYFDNSSLWDMVSGVEEAIGSSASDMLIVRAGGATVLRGGAGNDFLAVQDAAANAILYGGAGRDVFFNGPFNYRIMDFQVGLDRFMFGQFVSMSIDGADTLLTSNFGGVVRIVGINSLSLAQWQAHTNPNGLEFDAISDGVDAFTGGAEDDWAWTGLGADTLDGLGGADTLLGGRGDDDIDGGEGNDFLEGGSGNDLLIGGAGADTIDGDSGEDTVSYAGSSLAGVTINLATQTASGGDALGDTLLSIEHATAGEGDDTLTGSAAVNTLSGGGGADTFDINLASMQSGDAYLGGDGVDTVRVGDAFAGQQLFNFGLATVSSIERIEFQSTVGASIVGFAAGQLGAGFSNATQVVGSSGLNLVSVLAVAPSAFSLENWSFSNWSGGDAVLLDGSSGDDFITGSAQADQMNGHEGVDILNGGLGGDTFIVNLASMQDGDQYNGGDGTDTIRVGDALAGQQLFNFGPAHAAVSSIERVQFMSTTGVAIVGFAASQLGGGFSSNLHVIGSSTLNLVSVVAVTSGVYSLAGWTFENWSGDMVLFDGAADADTITGSSRSDFISGHGGADQIFGGLDADTIDGGAGADLMHGEDGADTFRISDTDFTPVTGDQFFGGADTDTLALLTSLDVGFWDVRDATFSSIERVDFSPANDGEVAWLTIGANQIGAGALSSTLVVDGSIRHDVLHVVSAAGGAFSLAGLQFTSWSSNDYVEIDGHETLADDIICSIADDQVEGFGGNDFLHGLAGIDILAGNDGDDMLDGGADGDFLIGDAGRDTALLEVNSADAVWHRNMAGNWVVSTAAYGQDLLQEVEFIAFNDRTIFLDRAAHTFSGDGASDILLYRASDGVTAIWSMNGAAVTAASPTAWQAGAAWGVIGVGDFNADGRDDFLLRRHADGVTAIWQMNGVNVAAADVTEWQAGFEWQIAGIGDFNGDNIDDFLWRRQSDGVLSIWQMDGFDVAAADVTSQQAGASWSVHGVGDFSGDGRDDLLIRRADGVTAVWQMQGSHVAGANITTQQAGTDWTMAGVGDFNGDGRDDIVLRRNDGVTAIWMMDNANVLSSSLTSQFAGADWNIANVGDYNADGRDDLLLAHSSGVTAIWLMNGVTVETAALTTQQAGLEWSII